jgi:methylthioribose-1-phosphate isomerase
LVANPAFDVTPAELIAAIITEKGVISRPDRNTVAAHCSAANTNKT